MLVRMKKETRAKPPLEKEIQLAICDYLAYKRYFFGRMNTQPIFDKDRGSYRAMPKYSVSGFPDIWVLHGGTFIGLEVKRPGTYQSDVQREFERNTINTGCQYWVVRSLDDVIRIGL